MDTTNCKASLDCTVQFTAQLLSLLSNEDSLSTDRDRLTLKLSSLYNLLISLKIQLQAEDFDELCPTSSQTPDKVCSALDQYRIAAEWIKDELENEKRAVALDMRSKWASRNQKVSSVLSSVHNLRTTIELALGLDTLYVLLTSLTIIHKIR
jgi:hypothetical protein